MIITSYLVTDWLCDVKDNCLSLLGLRKGIVGFIVVLIDT